MRSFLGLMLAVSLVVASYRPNRPAAAIAERNAAVRVVMERLNCARNEVARRYLDGDLDAAGAKAAMGRYWLQTPDQAAKTLRFIETYRSYVINYNLGRDLVAAWVADFTTKTRRKHGGCTEQTTIICCSPWLSSVNSVSPR